MKKSIQVLIALLLCSFISTFSTAAISSHSKPQTTKDSSLLIIDQTGKTLYTFKKGDKIVFTDKFKKNKAEIIGFDKDELIVRYFNTNKVDRIMPSKLTSIKKSLKRDGSVKKVLILLGLGGLATAIIASTSLDSSNEYESVAIFLLFVLAGLFSLLLLFIWGIYKMESGRKNKLFKLRKGLKAKVSG